MKESWSEERGRRRNVHVHDCANDIPCTCFMYVCTFIIIFLYTGVASIYGMASHSITSYNT